MQEEVLALAQECPEVFVIVSLDHSGVFYVDPRKPFLSIENLFKYIFDNKFHDKEILPNLIELSGRSLAWPISIFGGNLKGLMRAHRKNFMRAMILFGKPDLIHAHVTYPAGWVAMMLAREFNIPFIIKECMGPFPFKNRHFLDGHGNITKWIREPLENASQIIVMSPFLGFLMLRHGIKADVAFPYPVDERIFKPTPTQKDRLHKANFFTLCTLSKEKGIDDLLRGIVLALREDPNLFFTIGGPGPLDHYMKLAASLGILENIKWLGAISRADAVHFFNEADAFIMLSHFDTFGMVYAEALAMGKPVIATRCGGADDIINEENGLLVNVGDVGQIAQAIIRMSKSYPVYDPEIIRQGFMGKFSRISIVKKIMQCYREVLVK